jgi:hypothetical protein
MPKRHWWLLATTAIFAAGSANAQSPDLDKVDRMQRQMEQLQEQMKQVKSELVEAKKKAAEVKAEASAFEELGAATGGSAAKRPWPRRAQSSRCRGQPAIDLHARSIELHLLDQPAASGCGRLQLPSGHQPRHRLHRGPHHSRHRAAGVGRRRHRAAARIGVLGKFMGDWNYALIYDSAARRMALAAWRRAAAGRAASGIKMRI